LNAPLNRAQRRAMKKARKPAPERIIPLPPMLDEFTVFDMAQTILDKIANGAIETVQGNPVFRDNAGILCYVCPALDGWIKTWQRINDELGTNINMQAFGRIHNKLSADMPITDIEIEAALDALQAMRTVFRCSDRSRIASIATTAQIKMLIEERL